MPPPRQASTCGDDTIRKSMSSQLGIAKCAFRRAEICSAHANRANCRLGPFRRNRGYTQCSSDRRERQSVPTRLDSHGRLGLAFRFASLPRCRGAYIPVGMLSTYKIHISQFSALNGRSIRREGALCRKRCGTKCGAGNGLICQSQPAGAGAGDTGK